MQGIGRGTKPKRKSKAAVPKPPRGSGLNPSGQPSSNQLNIASEQLRIPDRMFDPYSDGTGGWQRAYLGKHSAISMLRALDTNIQSDDHTTPQFNIDEDGNFDVDALYGRAAGQMVPLQPEASTSSLPRSARDTSDGGVQLVPAFRPTNPTMMQRGEIPAGDVVHVIILNSFVEYHTDDLIDYRACENSTTRDAAGFDAVDAVHYSAGATFDCRCTKARSGNRDTSCG